MSDQAGDEYLLQLYAWVARIPRGRVVTYGQLALLIGRPRAARWVGRQMGRLPADSVLPWHRVVNARGRSSLPLDEAGDNRQLRLLRREGIEIRDGRIRLGRFGWDPLAGP
jgi:methylated-DNA-protein-cysteine methyltransferase-like protein